LGDSLSTWEITAHSYKQRAAKKVTEKKRKERKSRKRAAASPSRTARANPRELHEHKRLPHGPGKAATEVLGKETFSPAKVPPKKNLLATPLKKRPKPEQNDSSSSDESQSPHCSFHARVREKKAQFYKARQAKLPPPNDGKKSDSVGELDTSECEGEVLDDAAHEVDILLSQESEQDPNAAGAASAAPNPDSDSDSEANAKLPRKPIGLKY